MGAQLAQLKQQKVDAEAEAAEKQKSAETVTESYKNMDEQLSLLKQQKEDAEVKTLAESITTSSKINQA